MYGTAAVNPMAKHVAGLSLPASEVDFGRLGGSTRLASVVATVPNKLWKDVEKQLIKTVGELADTLPEGKLQLGLSTFDVPITPAKLNATGLTLKKVLRSRTGRSVRVTPNPELELSTAAVAHNHLTGLTGLELLVIATGGKTVIARTTAVQDIDSYTVRDRGRPKRDARVGMLPPKLAQIIINLAHPTPHGVVLDPFCGTGVLPQEALLMGYGVYGSDLEQRMVDYTRANLDWLATQYNISGRHIFLEQADATGFTNHDVIDAVACETYLGRPFTSKPSAELLAQTVNEVNLILKRFLISLRDQTIPGTPLCLAIPAWRTNSEVSKYRGQAALPQKNREFDTSTTGDRFKHLPLIDQISDLGYNRTRFEHIRDEDLIYYREDQIVARELLVLTRK